MSTAADAPLDPQDRMDQLLHGLVGPDHDRAVLAHRLLYDLTAQGVDILQVADQALDALVTQPDNAVVTFVLQQAYTATMLWRMLDVLTEAGNVRPDVKAQLWKGMTEGLGPKLPV